MLLVIGQADLGVDDGLGDGRVRGGVIDGDAANRLARDEAVVDENAEAAQGVLPFRFVFFQGLAIGIQAPVLLAGILGFLP